MSQNQSHHRREKNRYTVVLVPNNQFKTTKSFSIGVWGLGGVIFGAFVVIVVLTLTLLVYTPLGWLLPISNPELELRYGRQIASIQQQINELLDEMIQLREYNLRLRQALGEKISSEDSTLIVQQGINRAARLTAMANKNTTEPPQIGVQRTEFAPQVQMTELLRSQDFEDVQHTASIGEESIPMLTPAVGYFTRGFEPQNNHYGLDIAGKEGTHIVAAAAGKVIFSDWTYDYGFKIIIAHSHGYITVYKHNQALIKRVGDNVKQGETIALMGNTGQTSLGPHLHFEIWKDGVALNPSNYLLTIQ